MKNLKLSSTLSTEISLADETLTCSAFDIERGRVFFASSANSIYSLELNSSQKSGSSISCFLSDCEPIALEDGDFIVAMDYLMEKEALVIGTYDGCLLLHIVDSKTTEIFGRVEGGVKSIASSPDGDLLAVTAGLGQLLVMTNDWEVLYETAFDSQNNDMISDVVEPPCTQLQAPICWRGDGKYFAILGGDQNTSCHQKLRIWERESMSLHSSSESKVFMGASLDWMPSGAKLVAAIDRKHEQKCPLVVFFEKNGLERSSFAIDGQVDTLIDILKWNCNSELLAASVSYATHDAIKIWSFSNNHWYLKQEIRYLKKDGVKFFWDPIKPLHLICWTQGGQVTTYNFVWGTAVTETSTALVVDNSKVLISPLSLALMPPPMSLFNLKFPSAVQDITFLCRHSKNHLAASLADGSLCIVELPSTDAWEQFEDGEFSIEASHSGMALGTLMHLAWLDSHILLGVSCDTANPKTSPITLSLQEIELVCSEDCVPDSVSSSGWSAKISKVSSLERNVIAIVPNPAKRSSAFIQMEGGSVYEYLSSIGILSGSTGSQHNELDSEYGFSTSCPWMKAVLVCDNGIMKPLLFGLDDNGRLHLGRRILCNNCSSFSFYSEAGGVDGQVTQLILTTKQDLLFVVNIDDILQGKEDLKFECSGVTKKRAEETKEYLPIWERGAKSIGVIHGDEAAVILQTTRGNLECIYPRKLVLISIINALIQGRFRDAMSMVRQHRIDFNVLVDCCGCQAFIKSAAAFVTQVNNRGHITEFVCSIKNENVMNSLYKAYISRSSIETSGKPSENFQVTATENKISSVLLAVRKALTEQVPESPARELCILTTLVRSEPPALVDALERIKVTREMELSGVDDARKKLYPSSEESLKHLLWLTDADAVYEAALGLYDLNLAAIVALNSQKDPKEFLPYLKGLENLSPVIMKYTIDLKLRRYESALKHIISAGDDYFENCLNLMKDNPTLFPLGLQLISDNVKRLQVLEAWGDHLQDEKCFEDAASTYLCCSSFQKALKAYRDCGDWKGVLTVAGILRLAKTEVVQLANELCEELHALGKPAEAAKIALEYCGDVAKGVGYYVMAREWDEALRAGFMHEREDLVSDVKAAAVECAITLISEYKEGLEKVGKYLARYLAVRQRRILLAAKLKSEETLIDDPGFDTASVASSTFSDMSAYTTRSTKKSGASTTAASKRSQRKKGGKIRAGSPGEEFGLVDHLRSMALTDGAERELKSLILALLMLEKEDLARQLQGVADSFQLSQQAAVKLAEDTMDNELIDENTQTLDNYSKKLKATGHLRQLSWQSKVLLTPSM